ncbi:hypothetical protein DFJ58DRAFT_722653 [Suillus subalutaceus]|uniref:uncharacterized protein n=1 Tax=Suillus subalutaceus TaxID=48586 RepID=UPI001B883DD6|nr:uncharacterized protein DFJ58DRAFT_722653 [Suillus subalutaceus]KAG1871225.1 hypothetical protein DFJ58DRAFT_722653 [Suillus subalutaceus]
MILLKKWLERMVALSKKHTCIQLQEPTKSQCLASFIDCTGNAGMRQAVCVVCTSEVFLVNTEEVILADLPKSHLLIPSIRHPAQRLVDANGLWVGETPPECAILTFPERLLIGLYFPVSFIVKLYPQMKGSRNWDTSSLNSGIRGNVSTYRLNTDDVAAMVEGRLLPQVPDILPATIGITIIGPQNLPARISLRENPLYCDIMISDAHLAPLPMDPVVPRELLAVVKHSSDTHLLDRERDEYVVEDDDEDDNSEAPGAAFQTHAVMQGDTEVEEQVPDPCIVPLQANGVIDVEASHLSNQDILVHALSNVGNAACESYAVRHGGFVNEYERRNDEGNRSPGDTENPNHLLGTFPHLFPYGMGGFETACPCTVSYEAHAKWTMQYADRWFRQDLHFMFQVFGVIQKCQAFTQLTPRDFLAASQEESRKQLLSDPTVQLLKHHLSAVCTKVVGTDESQTKVRSYIWGMMVMKNPPLLWITINPTDTHDPIAQVFAGEDIDLDQFDANTGPDSTWRAFIVANDPYTAAKFFRFMVYAILEELFVESYIGTVEAQGRGTLHLHMIVWL